MCGGCEQAVGSIIFAVGIFVTFNQDTSGYISALELTEYLICTGVLIAAALLMMAAACTAVLGTYFWNVPLLIAVGKIINITI